MSAGAAAAIQASASDRRAAMEAPERTGRASDGTSRDFDSDVEAG